ncbi:hypothetical protein [Xanthomonas melonis]|nr:hypothetical protein [Xanthomonas melonis]
MSDVEGRAAHYPRANVQKVAMACGIALLEFVAAPQRCSGNE